MIVSFRFSHQSSVISFHSFLFYFWEKKKNETKKMSFDSEEKSFADSRLVLDELLAQEEKENRDHARKFQEQRNRIIWIILFFFFLIFFDNN